MNAGKNTELAWLIKSNTDVNSFSPSIEIIAFNQLMNAVNLNGYETLMIIKNPVD